MEDSTKQFINPYNFIPLPKEKTQYNRSEEPVFTGKMVVEIRTKTPLFIPNTSMKRQKGKHNEYEFYSYQNLAEKTDEKEQYYTPVIPGSSLRGMIRGVYETLTGSCMSAINDEGDITRRVANGFSPGLLIKEHNQCKLYMVDEEKIKEVPYKSTWIQNKQDGSKIEKGKYLLRGEEGPRKRWAKIFSEEGMSEEENVTEKDLESLTKVLEAYADTRINKHSSAADASQEIDKDNGTYKEYRDSYEKWKNAPQKAVLPVYYSIVEGVRKSEKIIYLSPAAMTKEAYRNKVQDILKIKGGFLPCESEEGICPACALFGTIFERPRDKEKQQGRTSLASKIRISDAKLGKGMLEEGLEELYEEARALQEMASPKIAAAEFYLKRPKNAKYWTYDYYYEGSQAHIHDVENKETSLDIAGRKYYWHHHNMRMENLPVLSEKEKTERNITVTAVKPEKLFETVIYFEQITKNELEQLRYICNISQTGTQGYKLGSGKPLGLGSVALEVKEIILREFNWEGVGEIYKERIYKEEQKNYEELGFFSEVKAAFDLLTTFDVIKKDMKITYPVTKQTLNKLRNGRPTELKSYEWFGLNRGNKFVKREKLKFRESLNIGGANPLTAHAVVPPKQNNQNGKNAGKRR